MVDVEYSKQRVHFEMKALSNFTFSLQNDCNSVTYSTWLVISTAALLATESTSSAIMGTWSLGILPSWGRGPGLSAALPLC